MNDEQGFFFAVRKFRRQDIVAQFGNVRIQVGAFFAQPPADNKSAADKRKGQSNVFNRKNFLMAIIRYERSGARYAARKRKDGKDKKERAKVKKSFLNTVDFSAKK